MVITEATIWQWLETVPDPEIPVISVVDLGVVRNVVLQEPGQVRVTITPTYSGCPAMSRIAADIRLQLLAQGLEQVQIDYQLSPAWTTDWLSAKGREQLKAYGIAPPLATMPDVFSLFAAMPAVPCPHCGSPHTVLVSQFGSTACKALYRCQDCLEPFDYFKCHR